MDRQQRKVGMIVRIPVDDTCDAFAQVLSVPEIAVLDLFRPRGELPSDAELMAAMKLFRVWVMKRALTSGRWQKVTTAPLRPAFLEPVSRFKRDPISGEYFLYFNGVDHPAQPRDCIGLEPATVWSAEHIEARLRDHLRGRPFDPEQVLPPNR